MQIKTANDDTFMLDGLSKEQVDVLQRVAHLFRQRDDVVTEMIEHIVADDLPQGNGPFGSCPNFDICGGEAVRIFHKKNAKNHLQCSTRYNGGACEWAAWTSDEQRGFFGIYPTDASFVPVDPIVAPQAPKAPTPPKAPKAPKTPKAPKVREVVPADTSTDKIVLANQLIEKLGAMPAQERVELLLEYGYAVGDSYVLFVNKMGDNAIHALIDSL